MQHVPPPLFVPPTDVTVLPATPPATAAYVKDTSKPAVRPNRITPDVWQVLQEYVANGGLLDLSEEIAALSQQEADVRADETLSSYDRNIILLRLAKERGILKERGMSMQEKRKNYLTYDMFGVFLDELFGILMKHIPDPVLLKKIGVDLGTVTNALRRRQAQGG